MKKDEGKEEKDHKGEKIDLVEEEIVSNKEIEELRQKAEECEGKYMRALADYQNLQKRVQEEKRDWVTAANRELLLRLLPVLDTLFLTDKHIKDDGLKVSISHFLDTLKAEGVTRLEVVGKDFDPALMEAVAVDKGEDGKVLDELRAGYLLNDKLLRPAQVRVGKKE